MRFSGAALARPLVLKSPSASKEGAGSGYGPDLCLPAKVAPPCGKVLKRWTIPSPTIFAIKGFLTNFLNWVEVLYFNFGT